MVHASITCELALGMDATLEATERELTQVRAILRDAIDALVAEFGAAAVSEGVVALQFQDLSDQILASVERRIGMLRSVLGLEVIAPSKDGTDAPIDTGHPEFFQEPK
jgi:hypothetical protein